MIHLFHTWSEWGEKNRNGCSIVEQKKCYRCTKIKTRNINIHDFELKEEGEERRGGNTRMVLNYWRVWICKNCRTLKSDYDYITLWDHT